MSTEITVVNDIVEINVQEDVIVIEAPSGAYPLPAGVYSVYGRTGNVVAQDGDYNLTQLGDVTITSPATGQVLRYNGTTWVNSTESYVGTVTSVNMSVPTGLTISGNPITTAGTLAVGLESGYSIPTTANQSLWTTAYNDKINSAAVTGLATKTLTLTQQDGGTITASWDDAEATRLVTEVYNSTGATLAKGTVVYINGGQGNLPTVTKAIATGDATSAQTYGVVQFDITNNNNGFVVVLGSLNNLDTQAYAVGTQLYLSGTTAGAWTSTKPYAPIHLVYVGIVVRSHPTQGVVEVRIQNGYEMDELHDVSAQNPNNGDILQYVAATDLWTKTAGTTTNIAEGTNLYYTDARSRAAFSESVTGLDYNSTTGVLSTTTGYGIPTTASQATWNTAYNDSIVSAGVTGTTTKTLTLNQQDGGTITASWTDDNTDAVTSVFGRTGAVTAQSGDYTTTQVTEGTNLYFTNTRARAAISETVTGLDYDNTTGVLSTSAGYGIPTTASQSNWDTAYTNRITSASAPLSIASNAISISQANTTTNGFLSSTDWNTFNNKQAAGNYITALTGEATASGPGSASVTLTNSAVIGKVLTGLNVTGGSVSATDSILDAFGKVQNQINGLIGGSIYQGVWNASTNTPTLTSSVGTKGYYYIVNVAGSTNLNGITDWKVGDWAIYDGTAWQKVDNTDAVSSVNGFTGAVSLTTDNISEGSTNLYFTNTRAQNAITLTTTGTSGAATYSGGTLNIPQYQAVLTNPVTGTGTTNTLPKFTGTSAIGNSNITDTGSIISLGSNTNISSGSLGIGSTSLTGYNLRMQKSFTGATGVYGMFVDSNIISDVTSFAVGFGSALTTQAASFTLPNVYHFFANNVIAGAGSTVTNQYGFFANSVMTGATNNYGFYGNIPASTNRWNLYMNGTAANYLAGALLIGTTADAGFLFRVNNGTSRFNGAAFALPASSGTTQTGLIARIGNSNSLVNIDMGGNDSGGMWLQVANSGNLSAAYPLMLNPIGGQVLINTSTSSSFALDVNGTARVQNELSIISNLSTSYALNLIGRNSSGNATTINFFNNANTTRFGYIYVDSSTYEIGSITGSNIPLIFTTNQTERLRIASTGAATFSSSVTAASFIPTSSTIPTNGMYLSGTNTLGFATNGTLDMVINEAGSVGIGTTSLTGWSLRVGRNITGATSSYGISSEGSVQSDVTTQARGFNTFLGTQAATFTLPTLYHYYASQATFGANSVVTNQHGFSVDSGLTGATNNFAFFSNLAAGTGRWNLYMNGTANNYLAGSLGIGITNLTGFSLAVGKNITGSVASFGIASNGTIQSDVTIGRYFYSISTTQAATFSAQIYHYQASQGTLGAGSTVTNQIGFIVDSTLIGATNNYGFYGNIPSGTNRWNLYMAGTAANYMAGQVGVGTTTLGSYIFNVGGSVATLVNFNSTNASGFYTTYSTSGVEKAYIGLGANTISGLSVSDLGIVGSANVVIASGSGGTETMRIDSTKRIGIGTGASINASAKVQIDSTTSGFLPPRMTAAQRAAIASPAEGLIVVQTDGTAGLYLYIGATWRAITMA